MIHCHNVAEFDVYECVLYSKGTHSLRVCER